MRAIVEPGTITGTVAAPPSKSMAQRSFAAALLHHGKTIIRYPGSSDDERAALNIVEQLGGKISQADDKIMIAGDGIIPAASINCGESGLAARLFIPICALSNHEITIQGAGSLLNRPMDGIEDVLQHMGVSMRNFNRRLPVTLQGPLKAASISIDGSVTSQFLSGLLLAMSYAATDPIVIQVKHLKSRPYIDMTLAVLAQFGKPIDNRGYKEFVINPSWFTSVGAVDITIEADWSGAANFAVAATIAGDIVIERLRPDSAQADRAIVEVLAATGATLRFENDTLHVRREALRSFDYDATHTPDLFPILSILAACCEGDSHISGVHRLFHKESNRVESIAEMLLAFNVPFSIESDTLCITGVKQLQGCTIDSFKDHRIAMAAAIGALRANGPVEIMDADAINKSYPHFFKDLALCGGKCTLQ